jgi:radical SAM protein with 4Fe4S-binding SPASM domain
MPMAESTDQSRKLSVKVRPLQVTMELTMTCNLRCIHCYNHPLEDQKELSLEEIRRIMDELAEAGCVYLSMTGGEIFCRPDIFDILGEARKRHFAITLLTNGAMITPEVADRLKAIQPWLVELSIYSTKPEVHDGITGIRGSFEKTRKAIDLLLERNLRLRLKTVIMTQNIGEYKDIMRHHRDLGVSFVLDPMITPKTDGSADPLQHRISDDQLAALLTDDEIGPEMIQFGTRRYDESRQLRRTTTMCTAGVLMCHIDPYGHVIPCVQFYLVAGNLREQSFSEIWNHSPVFEKLRKSSMGDIRECKDCELLGYCYRCPGLAMMEDGDAYGPSKNACATAELVKKIKSVEINDAKKI